MSSSVLVGVREQREEARALDRDREVALIEGLRARNAARHDLAGLGDVALQSRKVLVVDGLHALGGESAEFFAPREAARSTGFHNLATRADALIGHAAVFGLDRH